MEIITDAIPLNRLREMAKGRFGDMVKAVVDVDKGIMAVDGELHADFAHPRGTGAEGSRIRSCARKSWESSREW